jgi:type IV secretion system protein VirB1
MLPSIDQMQHCAPNVSPVTLAAIMQVESGGNPYALGINGWHGKKPHPKNASQAAAFARYFISAGYSVDLGIMQINSSNLKGLGLSISQVLDPCTNMAAGSRILSRGYAGATKKFGQGQGALRAALSAYNTGNYERGFKNGYVAKYYGHQIVLKTRLATKAEKQPAWNPYLAETTVYKKAETQPTDTKELTYEKD